MSVPPDTLTVMREELRNADAGRYLVTTATGSHYLLDLDARKLMRTMAATAPICEYLDAGFSQLRRDGEAMELLLLESCRVGAPALIWLQVRADRIPTLRTTSPVVLIEDLTVADQ